MTALGVVLACAGVCCLVLMVPVADVQSVRAAMVLAAVGAVLVAVGGVLVSEGAAA